MVGLRKRLFAGSLWISLARVVTNILSAASTLILARLLLPSDFGLVALGMTMLALVGALTDIALNDALVQSSVVTEEHCNTVWTFNIIRSASIAAIFAALAIPVSKIWADDRLRGVMLLLSLVILLEGFVNPRLIVVTRGLIFWQQSVIQVTQKIFYIVVAVLIAVAFKSYFALLVGSVIGQLAGLLLSYILLPYRPRFGLKHGRSLFNFSIWLTFCKTINTINWNFDQLFVGSFLGQHALGLYTVGNNIAVLPSRESTAPLTVTLFPAFAGLIDQPERLVRAYQKAQTMITAVALPLSLGVALVAEPLIRVCMGDKWLSVVNLVELLTAVFGLQTLGVLSQPLAMAMGKTRMLFFRDLQSFLVRIPILLIGIYYGGLHGIVIGRVFSGLISIILNLDVVKKLTGLSYIAQLTPNLRTIAGVLVMAMAVTSARLYLFSSPEHLSHPLYELCTLSLVGFAGFLTASLFLWAAAKFPDGPEKEVVEFASQMYRVCLLGIARRT